MTNAERIQANSAELQECIALAKSIVKPSGTLTIDTNGIHDVTAFESVDVNVSSGGGECDKPHINIVDELPETGTEGAFYGVNGAFLYVRMGADSGIMDIAEFIGEWIFIRTTSEEVTNMTVPEGISEAIFLYYCSDIPEMYLRVVMGGSWATDLLAMSEFAFDGSLSCKGEITDIANATEDGYYLYLAPSKICQFISHARRDFVKKGMVMYEDWEGDISKVTGIGAYHDENIIIQSTSPVSNYPVTEITSNAFQYTLIRNVTIPNTVEKIGNSAFQGCVALESVTFPDKHIEFNHDCFAFSNCYSLYDVTLGEGQGDLCSYMFENCISLTKIHLPSSLTRIWAYAFEGCTKLNEITFGGTVEQWKSVNLGDYWNKNVPATKVICSDGETSVTTSFTIATADNDSVDYKSYYANKNMTWAEWINSEYNTDSRFENINNGVWDTQSEAYIYTSGDSNGTQVNSSDKIIEYATYYIPYESV